MKTKKYSQGFTLVELLLVIAIIAIIAAVIFVALDPLTRFRDSRDSARWQDVAALSNAIQIDQIDNGGSYLAEIAALTAGDVYMINDGSTATGCNAQNANCDVDVTSASHCVDLSGLVSEGYIGAVPVSQNGAGTWTAGITGYTLTASTTGAIAIQACESENSSDIIIIR
jgi:prepilin-type N-terminal cleavage/methylation domain-containing protein